MPGFVMHLAEAGLVLKKLEARRRKMFPETWKNQYELGAILPDVRVQGDKRYTHFWCAEELERFARAPYLPAFLTKYRSCLPQPVVLGYLVHLHLDVCYVERYWPTVFTLENEAGETEDRYTGSPYVRLKRDGAERIPRKEFFSEKWYYGDYTILNGYLMEKYDVQVPVYPPIEPFEVPIEEVDAGGFLELIGRFEGFLTDFGDRKTLAELKVLEPESAERFLEESAEAFVRAYGHLL